MSPTPEPETQWNPCFEWGYPQSKFDVSISFVQDSSYIDLQTGNFADFEKFKTDSHFGDFV